MLPLCTHCTYCGICTIAVKLVHYANSIGSVTGSWPFGGKDVKLEGVPFAVLPSGKRIMQSV